MNGGPIRFVGGVAHNRHIAVEWRPTILVPIQRKPKLTVGWGGPVVRRKIEADTYRLTRMCSGFSGRTSAIYWEYVLEGFGE